MNFSDLNLVQPLQKSLLRNDFLQSKEIQDLVIPKALENNDILVLASTGSGKTLSFLLPILNNLYIDYNDNNNRFIKAVILAPTRELAIQIGENMKLFSNDVNFKYGVIFGGVNQFHQVKALQKGIDILIGTPGRIIDLINQGFIDLSQVSKFVLDEADKMLDMGFLPDINKIISKLPKNKNTFLFSATMPASLENLAMSLLKNPEKIVLDNSGDLNIDINQEVYFLKQEHKKNALVYLCQNPKYKSIIVFVNTKEQTEVVLGYLKKSGISSDNIHRNRSQNARQRAINSLKSGEIKVLVATDVASRGIDINDLSLVINYDLPKLPETYVHRIGRTARNGNSGLAFLFCSDDDKFQYDKIINLISKPILENTSKEYLKVEVSSGEYLGSFGVEKSFNKQKNNSKKRYYPKNKK